MVYFVLRSVTIPELNEIKKHFSSLNVIDIEPLHYQSRITVEVCVHAEPLSTRNNHIMFDFFCFIGSLDFERLTESNWKERISLGEMEE